MSYDDVVRYIRVNVKEDFKKGVKNQEDLRKIFDRLNAKEEKPKLSENLFHALVREYDIGKEEAPRRERAHAFYNGREVKQVTIKNNQTRYRDTLTGRWVSKKDVSY